MTKAKLNHVMWAALMVCGMQVPSAFAQTAPVATPNVLPTDAQASQKQVVTLEEYLRLVVRNQPSLAADRLEAGIAKADTRTASAFPNPTASVYGKPGEHGVGIEKINQMCSQFGTPEIKAFHRVKAAFDPDGLLNPGKAIPTLNRCAEYGRERMGASRPPAHPDLPRF